MNEIQKHLKNKKRTFAQGVKLYNEKKRLNPSEPDKWSKFLKAQKDVKPGDMAFNMLENRLKYIVTVGEQIAKKKGGKEKPKAIIEDPNDKAKEDK